jgi:hypothetical protein
MQGPPNQVQSAIFGKPTQFPLISLALDKSENPDSVYSDSVANQLINQLTKTVDNKGN